MVDYSHRDDEPEVANMKRTFHRSRLVSDDSKDGRSHVPRRVALGAALGVMAILLVASVCMAGWLWNPGGVPVCTAPSSQYNPTSVSDGAGGTITAWQDYRSNNGYAIFAQRVDSSGKALWTGGGVAICNLLNASCYDPDIATDGAGGAIITWYDYRSNTKVYAQRVNPQGVVQWASNGVALAPNGTSQEYPKITADGAGGAVFAWREYDSPEGIYTQRVSGAGALEWGLSGVAVCTVGSSQSYAPDICTDGAHGAIISWYDQRNGSNNLDVFAQRVNQAGAPAWTPNGISVCTAAGNQQSPTLASDSAGGAVIAWQDGRSSAADDIFSQRVSPSGAVLWSSNGTRVCGSAGNQQNQQLISDGSGNSIIVWEDSRSGRTDIYAQKLLASGARAPGWSANGLAVTTSNISHFEPVLVGDGSGGAIITWIQGTGYFFGGGAGNSGGAAIEVPRVYAQQVLSGGMVSPGWSTNGDPVCNVDTIQEYPSIVSDGAGGAIIAWEDARSSDWDIYAQRVRAVTSTWYLAEGSSAWGYSTYITIENPNPGNVAVNINYMTPGGALAPRKVTLPAKSQTTVDPLADIGYKTDFSTKVQSVNGLPIGVDRTMTWTGPGAPSPEAHSSVGVNSPNTTWYLPEGCSAYGFESWLLIQNPNANAATCTVTYMIQNAGPQVFTKVVPANSRRSFNMADDIGQQNASIQVVSNIPVVPERSMYRNNRREGSDSTGATEAATDYYLAEGTTNYGFTTYVLVQNPNSSSCFVSLTFMTPKGPISQAPFSMAPYSRQTVRVNDVLPNSDFSTQVHADLPVIAERALYWGAGSPLGEAMHDSIGVASPHAMWYLPDGQSSEGRETYTLVQNPNDTPVVVEISYLVAGGGSKNVTFKDTIPAQSRQTYSLADKVPSGRAAIMVTSKTSGKKIIVERSMYWNNRGAGTCTIGGSSN
jgi:hypothetical protein